jgi:hypothetical protein
MAVVSFPTTVVIERPVQEVFHYMCKVERMSEWIPFAQDVRLLVGAGATVIPVLVGAATGCGGSAAGPRGPHRMHRHHDQTGSGLRRGRGAVDP